jgi:hypothetical protein
MTRSEAEFYDNFQFPRDAEFFKGFAKEAAESRLCAGIHYRSALVAGLAQADAVAGINY